MLNLIGTYHCKADSKGRVMVPADLKKQLAGVRTVEMDTAGRLNIPRDLMDFAGIHKEIVVSSAISIVEIWDATKYEKAIDDAANDFADLAEEVMGGVNDDDNGIS